MPEDNLVLQYLRTNGVFVYVNTGRTEPTYIAGPGKPATREDIRAAIKFLTTLDKMIEEGVA